MKSKYLSKKRENHFKLNSNTLRKAIVIPTLSVIMLGAEYAPQLFFSNQAVLELINELPSTAVVQAAPLTEKELEEYPDEARPASDVKNGDIGVYNKESTLATVKYCKSTGKPEVYLTTHGYTNYPELRKALEDEYGLYFMLESPDDTVADSYHNRWKDILNSKAERKKLAKLAEKYIPGMKASYAAAPEVVLATYYGAINDPWDYVKYSENDTITRNEMCALVYRAWASNLAEYDNIVHEELAEAMGKNNKYNLYLSSVNYSMYGGVKYVAMNGKTVGKYDKKAMNSSATRKEVLYLALECYNPAGWGLYDGKEGGRDEAYMKKAVKEAKKIFKDLGKSSEEDCLIAYRAYKLGLIKPDKNGNSNLNKKCSMSLALRYIYAVLGADC